MNEFYQYLTENPDTIVIDVRAPNELLTGSVAAAININIEDPSFNTTIAKLDKNSKYAVYCKLGGRSQKAINIMAELGFTNVFPIAGALDNWVVVGYPIFVPYLPDSAKAKLRELLLTIEEL